MRFILFIMMALISLPGLCQEEDEAFLEEISEERLKKVEKANELNRAREDIQKKTFDMAHELQKIGKDKLDYAALFDDKVQAILQQALKESAIRNQSPEFIRAMIMGKVKGKPMEKVFTQFPKLLDIIVDIMRDREALPGLIRLFSKKEDLKNYAIFWVCLVIVGYFIRKKFIPQEIPFFRRMTMRILFSLFMTTVSLSVFYTMFKPEVGPAVSVVARHF